MSFGNKYVFVVVDDYFKSCETCPVKEHDDATMVRFLEKETMLFWNAQIYSH
jgi:hypothetical protein